MALHCISNAIQVLWVIRKAQHISSSSILLPRVPSCSSRIDQNSSSVICTDSLAPPDIVGPMMGGGEWFAGIHISLQGPQNHENMPGSSFSPDHHIDLLHNVTLTACIYITPCTTHENYMHGMMELFNVINFGCLGKHTT